tara:strand:- start:670 stop:1503 length:834 start_codon:yes stop_codon:yes gene_type:complete
MVSKNTISLLKYVSSYYVWVILSFMVLLPSDALYAQDPDDEGVIFWGDEEEDEEDEEVGEDEFEEEEYLDDEEYYDDEEAEEEEDYSDEEDDESYYEDNRLIDDEDDYGEDEEQLAGEIDRSGWSVDISGSIPRLVNYTLWKEFNLEESKWEPKMDGKISIEAPYMLNLLGLRFRAGAEFGTFGFTDLSLREAELKGVSAVALVSIPAGPGKIKMGTGIFGKTMGFMFEATYGMAMGSLDLRVGMRTTELLNAVDSGDRSLGHLGWMDGLMVLGVNF